MTASDSSQRRVLIVAASPGRSGRNLPLGAARVVSALRVHPAVRDRLEAALLSTQASDEALELASTILARRPFAVGFSLYVWNRDLLSATARFLRGRVPGVLLFAGGPEATADPEGVIAEGSLDFCVVGEGEESAALALERVLAGESPKGLPGVCVAAGRPGTGCGNPGTPPIPRAVADLSRVASPYLDGVLDPAEFGGALWELARGCPFACFFCYESKGCRGVRRFPDRTARAELESFVRAGIREVFVLDPTFNADPAKAREVLGLIRRKAPGVHFTFEARAEFLDGALARAFAALQCSVQIGLQSARPEVLAAVGRPGFDRREFRRKTALLSREGAVFGLDLIYGLPGDDLEGFRDSLDFALSLEPNHLDVFRLSVLPGTELEDRADGLGILRQKRPPYGVLSTPTFPASDLDRAETLARTCDLFYSRGRSVGWFVPVLRPLRKRPSAFFLEISRRADAFRERFATVPEGPGHADIEGFQLDALSAAYREASAERLLPAVRDLVRLHGAWSRALAEGQSSELDLAWPPEVLFGAPSRDLSALSRVSPGKRTAWIVRPGSEGPVLSPRGRPRRRQVESR